VKRLVAAALDLPCGSQAWIDGVTELGRDDEIGY
jgi:hypothetical protein